MYLIMTAKEGFKQNDDVTSRSSLFPGNIGEAAQAVNLWEAAIESLDRQGLIDPKKVGIIGFSRTDGMLNSVWCIQRFILRQQLLLITFSTVWASTGYGMIQSLCARRTTCTEGHRMALLEELARLFRFFSIWTEFIHLC